MRTVKKQVKLINGVKHILCSSTDENGKKTFKYVPADELNKAKPQQEKSNTDSN